MSVIYDIILGKIRSGGDVVPASALAPTNYVTINSEADFTQSGGKNLLENKVYRFNGLLILTRPFDVSGITGVCFIVGRAILLYTGTGALFDGTFTGALEATDLGIVDTTGQTIFNCTGAGSGSPTNLMLIRRTTFIDFADRGFVKDFGGGVLFETVQYSNCGLGAQFKDCGFLKLDTLIANTSSTNTPQFSLDGAFGDVLLTGSTLSMNAGESFLQISSNATFSKVNVRDVPFSLSDGGEFLATAKTGSITAYVSNGSLTTVTSAAHGMTVEQVLTISGTTNYNATFDISNITTNTFDIDKVFVADDATGSFTTGDSNIFLDSNDFQFFNNGDQNNSAEIAQMTIASPFTVTIPGAATIVEAVGVTNDWNSVIARRYGFELDGSGRFRYTGTKERSFFVTANISVASGGAKLMVAYIMKNGVAIGDSMFAQTSNREVGFSPSAIVSMSTGNYLSLGVENVDDGIDLDLDSGTLNSF